MFSRPSRLADMPRLERLATLSLSSTTLPPRRRAWLWMLPGNVLAVLLLAAIVGGCL